MADDKKKEESKVGEKSKPEIQIITKISDCGCGCVPPVKSE